MENVKIYPITKNKYYENLYWYREYTITKRSNGYWVFFEGDELYFKTIEECKEFINEAEEAKEMYL